MLLFSFVHAGGLFIKFSIFFQVLSKIRNYLQLLGRRIDQIVFEHEDEVYRQDRMTTRLWNYIYSKLKQEQDEDGGVGPSRSNGSMHGHVDRDSDPNSITSPFLVLSISNEGIRRMQWRNKHHNQFTKALILQSLKLGNDGESRNRQSSSPNSAAPQLKDPPTMVLVEQIQTRWGFLGQDHPINVLLILNDLIRRVKLDFPQRQGFPSGISKPF
ncbi:hypothetical protein GQ457_11G018950 [Hibiscus cannabinus]